MLEIVNFAHGELVMRLGGFLRPFHAESPRWVRLLARSILVATLLVAAADAAV